MENGKFEIIRSIVRPLVTVAGFGSVVYMVIEGITVPEWYWTLVASLVAFWFAGRAKK